jgi:hypothetical protein
MTSFWTTVLATIAAGVPLIALLGAVGVWVVKTIVRVEMDASNAELLTRINGTYVRANGSTLTGAEIERILKTLTPRRAHA